jgi:hypothetical protein
MAKKQSGLPRAVPTRRGANGTEHTPAGVRRTGTMIKLLQRIEREQARATARVDIEAGIRAANAVLDEPDIWQRDSILAQEAMVALWHAYGVEALVLAPH